MTDWTCRGEELGNRMVGSGCTRFVHSGAPMRIGEPQQLAELEHPPPPCHMLPLLASSGTLRESHEDPGWRQSRATETTAASTEVCSCALEAAPAPPWHRRGRWWRSAGSSRACSGRHCGVWEEGLQAERRFRELTLSSRGFERWVCSSRAMVPGTQEHAVRGGSWAGTGFPAAMNLPTQQLHNCTPKPKPYATHSSSVHCGRGTVVGCRAGWGGAGDRAGRGTTAHQQLAGASRPSRTACLPERSAGRPAGCTAAPGSGPTLEGRGRRAEGRIEWRLLSGGGGDSAAAAAAASPRIASGACCPALSGAVSSVEGCGDAARLVSRLLLTANGQEQDGSDGSTHGGLGRACK